MGTTDNRSILVPVAGFDMGNSSMARRNFTKSRFEDAFQKTVEATAFFEGDKYYRIYKRRYEVTLDTLFELPLPTPAKVVEIGGGQLSLLCNEMYGDQCAVWDVNDQWSDPLKNRGVSFDVFDVVHAPHPPLVSAYDVVFFCEVIEHMPICPEIVIRKIGAALKPGGYLVITTPNIFRLRNALFLLAGKDIFCDWKLTSPGQPLGHVTEFSLRRLNNALSDSEMDILISRQIQFVYRGSSLAATAFKRFSSAFTLLPRFRDGLIAIAQKRLD